MNRSTRIVLIILAVVALVGFLLIGGGFLRDRNSPRSDLSASEDGRMKLLDQVLAPTRREFDLERLSGGCERTGRSIRVASECEIAIAGVKGAPSVFYLVRQSGSVRGCYGFTEDAYRKCLASSGDDGPQRLEPRTRFTAATDSAKLWLQCEAVGGNGCTLSVASR